MKSIDEEYVQQNWTHQEVLAYVRNNSDYPDSIKVDSLLGSISNQYTYFSYSPVSICGVRGYLVVDYDTNMKISIYNWERGKDFGFYYTYPHHVTNKSLRRATEDEFQYMRDSLAKKYGLPLDSIYYAYYIWDDNKLSAWWRLRERSVSLIYHDSNITLRWNIAKKLKD